MKFFYLRGIVAFMTSRAGKDNRDAGKAIQDGVGCLVEAMNPFRDKRGQIFTRVLYWVTVVDGANFVTTLLSCYGSYPAGMGMSFL